MNDGCVGLRVVWWEFWGLGLDLGIRGEECWCDEMFWFCS